LSHQELDAVWVPPAHDLTAEITPLGHNICSLLPSGNHMRRVLLIAFFYPPAPAVGGLRPAALAKYLPRFGWEAIVLTPRLQGVNRESKSVIETEYRDVLKDWKTRLHLDPERELHERFALPMARKPGSEPLHTRLLSLATYALTYPDPYKGWIPFALAAVEQIRRKVEIDAIVTTSPPISCHLIGRQVKRMLGCPWIADFRDLWTQNLGIRSRRFLQTGLEKRTLKQADALVTVSAPWASRLQRGYPNTKICTITNGFDPDDYCSPSRALTSEFSVTYTGQLYASQRNPTMLFEVVRDLIKEEAISASDVRIRFYGTLEPWLPLLIKDYGLGQIVEVHGPIPREMALEHQRESQLLLVLPWSHPRETGHHSAKLFEYFAAARPILAVGGNRGVLTQALEETRAGMHALSKEQLRDFLLSAYADYKECGRVSYYGDRKAIDKYSHPEMARSFAQILDTVVHSSERGSPEVR
jgi:glycosyltransferase involved in cell wall biosynthesis